MGKKIILLLSSLALAGCVKTVSVKDANIPIPEKFREQKSAKVSGPSPTLSHKYWESFGDAKLNSLVEQGLRNNSDLKAAAFRLERDFALARLNFGKLFPEISANPSLQYLGLSLNTGTPIEALGIPRTQTRMTLPLDFSYEIDLWGRVRNLYRAARAQAKNSYFTYLDTQLLLTTEIIKTYYQLRYDQLSLELARRNEQICRQQLSLQHSLTEAGLSNTQSTLESESRCLEYASLVSGAELNFVRSFNALAILVNESPSSFNLQIASLSFEQRALGIPDMIPSLWIRKRPDILAAEQNILGANALSKSALAEFFPKITFNARFGLDSLSSSNLFSQGSQFFALGPSLSLPIFNMGQTLANLRAREAEAKVALENYKKTVLNAFKDVEDHLAAFNEAEKDFANYQKIWKNAQKNELLAADLQRAGLNNRQQALSSQIARSLAQQDAAARQLKLLQQSAELLRSFGGGLGELLEKQSLVAN